MKNLTKIFFLLFLIMNFPVAAQVSQEWEARYNSFSNQDDYVVDMVLDKEGNIYVTGYSIITDLPTRYDIVTLKYNNAGALQWVRTFNGTANGYDSPVGIAVDDSGYVYVGGFTQDSITKMDYLIIKYKTNGDTVWIRQYNYNEVGFDYARAMTIDKNSNIYITGEGGNQCLECGSGYMTVKFNRNGEHIWTSLYKSPFNASDLAHFIKADNDGFVYVTGQPWHARATTIKYNSETGDSIWTRDITNFGAVGEEINLDSAGNVVVNGSGSWIIKLDSIGSRIWLYNGTGSTRDLIVNNNYEFYYTTGYQLSNLHTQKIDSAGNLIWEKLYSCSQNSANWGESIVLDQYENIFLTGFTDCNTLSQRQITRSYTKDGIDRWTIFYGQSIFLNSSGKKILTDTFGNIYTAGNSQGAGTGYDITLIKYNNITSIRQTSHEIPANFTLHQNYPNPFNPLTTIKYEIPVKSKINISIFGITGKKIIELINEEHNPGIFNIKFNGSSLPSGTYFLRLIADENIIDTKKLILIK